MPHVGIHVARRGSLGRRRAVWCPFGRRGQLGARAVGVATCRDRALGLSDQVGVRLARRGSLGRRRVSGVSRRCRARSMRRGGSRLVPSSRWSVLRGAPHSSDRKSAGLRWIGPLERRVKEIPVCCLVGTVGKPEAFPSCCGNPALEDSHSSVSFHRLCVSFFFAPFFFLCFVREISTATFRVRMPYKRRSARGPTRSMAGIRVPQVARYTAAGVRYPNA